MGEGIPATKTRKGKKGKKGETPEIQVPAHPAPVKRELNEDSFLEALSELGGSAPTRAIRAQLILPDWHIINDSEIRKIAEKLATDGKVIVDKSKRIWVFNLKND